MICTVLVTLLGGIVSVPLMFFGRLFEELSMVCYNSSHFIMKLVSRFQVWMIYGSDSDTGSE